MDREPLRGSTKRPITGVVACCARAARCEETRAARSLEHLVGTRRQGDRQCKAKQRGGLEVDRHVESARLLDRHLGRPCAPGDAIDIVGDVAEQADEVIE